MSLSPNEVITLAQIGCGYWGPNLLRNFSALKNCCVKYAVDSSAERRGFVETNFADTKPATELETVLADPEVDAVVIATPAATHYAMAKKALAAGKHVFVEKPLCLEVGQAEELVGRARDRGRILMVGHLLQYHPCVQVLQTMIGQGELGKLYYITSNRLNLGKIRREENALWNFAPHDVSVIMSLAGGQLPERIQCRGQAYLNSGIADTTLTSMLFSGGLRAHVYVSWLNPFKEQKLTVVGSKAMVVFDDTQAWPDKVMIFRDYLTWSGGQVPVPNKSAGGSRLEVPESEPLLNECRHFLDCCATGQAPKTDGAEGLRVLQVLHAAQASLDRDGESVECHLSNPGSAAEAPPLSPQAGANDYYVHPTAVVDEGAVIGKGTKIWHFSHIMKGARIGERCILGQNVNVDGGTRLGNNVKVQNNVSIYTGVEIEDDVFLGPSCVLTNVTNPRAQINRHQLYEKTVIKRGATIGANATILCGIKIGRYAFVAAGAVVTKEVPDYALMIGNPARQKGWMSRHGQVLRSGSDGICRCPEAGLRYQESAPGVLRCLDLDEEAELPPSLALGKRAYDEFKRDGAH